MLVNIITENDDNIFGQNWFLNILYIQNSNLYEL